MKRTVLFAGTVLLLLTLVGCNFSIYEMGLPLVPTATITVIPSEVPTSTPTLPPKPEKTEGIIQITQLEDGATLMVDTELGYQIVFSPEWFVVGLDSDVENQLSSVFGAEVPEGFLSKVNTTQSMRGARAVALDYTSYFYDMGELNAHIQVVFMPDSRSADQEVDLLVDNLVNSMPTQEPQADVIYEVIQTNPGGVEYGKLIINYPRETFGLPGKQMVVIVKVPGGLLTLTGSAIEEEYQLVEQNFQRVVDSIEFVQEVSE